MSKKRLFIASSHFCIVIASAIIKQMHYENDENTILIVANYLDTKFLETTKEIAQKTELFSKILFFNDYSKDIKIHKVIDNVAASSFNINRFKEDTQTQNFDEIISTCLYRQSVKVIYCFPDSEISLMENGTASYLEYPAMNQVMMRAKKMYSLNYFDKIYPDISCNKEIKYITIDKNITKELFEKLAADKEFEGKENAVILTAHNLSIDKVMSIEEEFSTYYEAIKNLLAEGYTVYFKDHPKTPDMFYGKLRAKLTNKNLISLKNHASYPIEILFEKIKPKAVISIFSTSLLTAPHLFSIPSFTIFPKYNLSGFSIYYLAFILTSSYIPDYKILCEKKDTEKYFQKHLKEQPLISQHPLYRIITSNMKRQFLSKKDFLDLKNSLTPQIVKHLEYFGLKSEVLEIYKDGNYVDFLIYYAKPFSENIKKSLKKSSFLTFMKKAVHVFKEMVS